MRKLITALATLLLVLITGTSNLAVATPISATTSSPDTGTLTIAKHWDANGKTGRKYPALGTEFTVAQVATVNGKPVNVFELKTLPEIELIKTNKANTFVGLTDQSGVETFTDLPIGLYLVSETKTPTGIPSSEPFLISIPMTQNGKWVYDVGPIVPKNNPTTNPENPLVDVTISVVADVINEYADSADVQVTVDIANISKQKAQQVEGYLEPPDEFVEWQGTETATHVPGRKKADGKDESYYEGLIYYRSVHFPVEDLDVKEHLTYTLVGKVYCSSYSGTLWFPVHVDAFNDDESNYRNNDAEDKVNIDNICNTVSGGGQSPAPNPQPTPISTEQEPVAQGSIATAPVAARLFGRLTRTGTSLVLLAITATLATTGYVVSRRKHAKNA